jgi:hypothetical protein
MRRVNKITVVAAIGICSLVSMAKEIVYNGDFKQLINKQAKHEKIVTGEKFIKGWGIAGSAEVISKDEKNQLKLTSGVIYSWMQRSWTAPAEELEGEITASGSGKLKIQLSTCIKKDARQPFSHSKRTVVGEFAMGKEAKTFKFKYKLEAGEVGYIYVYAVDGSVIISRISANTTKIEK